MGAFGIVMLVCVILATDAVVIWGVGQVVGKFIRPLAEANPPVAPAADAVTRKFQSLSFGMCSFGCGVHVSVDDSYLHLTPASFSKFFGLRAMSIPWGRIQARPRPRFGRALKVRVGTIDITGPAWCLSLAGREEQRESTEAAPPGPAV